ARPFPLVVHGRTIRSGLGVAELSRCARPLPEKCCIHDPLDRCSTRAAEARNNRHAKRPRSDVCEELGGWRVPVCCDVRTLLEEAKHRADRPRRSTALRHPSAGLTIASRRRMISAPGFLTVPSTLSEWPKGGAIQEMPPSGRLQGIFSPRVITIPGNLDFGRVPPGKTEDRLLTLRNDGVEKIRCRVTCALPFSVISPPECVLEPGGTVESTIRYSCDSWGPVCRSITLQSDEHTRTLDAIAGISFGDVFLTPDQDFCFDYHSPSGRHPIATSQARAAFVKDARRP